MSAASASSASAAAVPPTAQATVWTEKYRPSKLADIKGHRRIKLLFERAAAREFVGFPPVILYGPPGTGKTSIALTLPQETYPAISPANSTLYLNASDERSVDVIRERILQFTQTIWPGVRRKFVIFDEVETMTEQAQASLRALLDDVDRDGHSSAPVFLFLCNSLYRVHPTLRSRCVALFCGHVPISHVRDTLESIQRAEGVAAADIKVPSDLTFKIQRGDLRSFVAAVQFGTELNPWDAWFLRLEEGGKKRNSVFAWEDGLSRSPFCLLVRHVFIWMNEHAMMEAGFAKAAAVAAFVQTCLEVQDAPQDTVLKVIPSAWEEMF
jgi:DNA polymerase III delta prime subunit